MTPKIFICGDTHGSLDHIVRAALEHRPDALILLGDVQAQKPLELELARILEKTEIWFIHGNHDTDSEQDYDNLFGSTLGSRNIHGRVVEIAGIRVAGLGGVFREEVWRPPSAPTFGSSKDFVREAGEADLWRGGLPLKHRSTIFPEDYAKLATIKADVLVTHEAPSSHPHGFEAIDALARSIGASSSFHGHHHDRLDYTAAWESLGFQAYGVGLCGITDHQGNVIRAGDEDSLRSLKDYEDEKAWEERVMKNMQRMHFDEAYRLEISKKLS